MGKDKELLGTVQELCRFANKRTGELTGIDVEFVHQALGVRKNNENWEITEVRVFQRGVREALLYVSEVLKRTDIHLEIEPPQEWHRVANDGEKIRLETRRTTGPYDRINFRIEFNNPEGKSFLDLDDLLQDLDIEAEGTMPLVVFRVIELLTELPPNTLRVCRDPYCTNTFASFHKNQAYCSVTCRNRQNTYAWRRRAKREEKR